MAKDYQAYRLRKAELRALRGELGILDEPKLSVNAIEVLEKRYLLKDEKGQIIETPTGMFWRVAKAIAAADKAYGGDPEAGAKEFYTAMSRLEFIPNSPTLFNAGTKTGFALSACYVLPVEDSLEGIFTTLKNMALIEQTGGGVGFDFSRLRPSGDVVKTTMGVASGPVSFMKIFDAATEVIKAGGRRRGAMMAILRVDHPDVIEFITSKARPGVLTNFNISVTVTDAFMEAVEKNQDYDLINPRTKKPAKRLSARYVWDRIVDNAWRSGDPGIVFIDEVNRYNPTPALGAMESTNPCVTPETWIMTGEGPRQVGELLDKGFVAVVNGEKWNGSRTGFFPTGHKPVYRLKTREGFELGLTEDHPRAEGKEIDEVQGRD